MLAYGPLDFTNSNDRQEATKQKEQRGEQTEATNQHADIDPGG